MRPMRMRWKLVGLAGLAGVAATGVVLARQRHFRPDEVSERLHRRLAEVSAAESASATPWSG